MIAWKTFLKTFFLGNACSCVFGPWPWPRAFLSLASRGSVLGKAVLGLGLGFFCVLGYEPCVLDSTSGITVSGLWLVSRVGSFAKTKSHVDVCNETRRFLPVLQMPADQIKKTKGRGGVLEDVLGLKDTFWSPWPWPRSLKSSASKPQVSKVTMSSARGQHYFLYHWNLVEKRQKPSGKICEKLFCFPQLEIAWKFLLLLLMGSDASKSATVR